MFCHSYFYKVGVNCSFYVWSDTFFVFLQWCSSYLLALFKTAYNRCLRYLGKWLRKAGPEAP